MMTQTKKKKKRRKIIAFTSLLITKQKRRIGILTMADYMDFHCTTFRYDRRGKSAGGLLADT